MTAVLRMRSREVRVQLLGFRGRPDYSQAWVVRGGRERLLCEMRRNVWGLWTGDGRRFYSNRLPVAFDAVLGTAERKCKGD